MTIISKIDPPSMVYFQEGSMILIDKNSTWSSFDAVAKVRGILRHKLQVKKIKVGHAGTLDPMATGLLIICTGKYTKRIESFQDLTKEYSGTMLFGATTPSYDAESDIDQEYDTSSIDVSSLQSVVDKTFTGPIQQEPPMFSAIKIKGQRLYKLARKGISVKRKLRDCTIDEYSLDTKNFPTVGFKIVCSKGTYVRSLVHDLGKEIKNGAYMTSLRRDAIGEYLVKNAMTIDDFQNYMESVIIPDK